MKCSLISYLFTGILPAVENSVCTGSIPVKRGKVNSEKIISEEIIRKRSLEKLSIFGDVDINDKFEILEKLSKYIIAQKRLKRKKKSRHNR